MLTTDFDDFNFADIPLTDGRPLDRLELIKNRYGFGRSVASKAMKVLLGNSSRRTPSVVESDYGSPRRPLEWNLISRNSPIMVSKFGRWVIVSEYYLRLDISEMIRDAIMRSGARSVLDVGCGEGVNIGFFHKYDPLLFSEIDWKGFDLLSERTNRAEKLLNGFYEHSNVAIWTGDATAPQVQPDSIDLACSIHVLEQIQTDWELAIQEMRKAAKYVLLIEPFYERQTWAGKLHSLEHGYFRGTIQRVLDLGFAVIGEYRRAHQGLFNQSTALLLQRI